LRVARGHSFAAMEETSQHSVNTHDPSIRKMLIRQYDKHGKEFILSEYGVSDRSVRRWKKLWKESGSLGTSYAASAKRSSLSPKEMARLERELIKNPYATDAELAANIKNKISPRAVGKALAKSKHQFSWKLEGLGVEETINADVVAETKAFFNKIKKTPEGDRIYVDETYASSGIKRRRADFRRAKNHGLQGIESTLEWLSSVQ
jgi:transposase